MVGHLDLLRLYAKIELVTNELMSFLLISFWFIKLVLNVSIIHALLSVLQLDFLSKTLNLGHYIFDWSTNLLLNVVNLTYPCISICLLNLLEPEKVFWYLVIFAWTSSSPSEDVLILKNHGVKLLISRVVDVCHDFLICIRHNGDNEIHHSKGQSECRYGKHKLSSLTIFVLLWKILVVFTKVTQW